MGSIAFGRSGDLSSGTFEDPQVLKKFGDAPDDLTGLSDEELISLLLLPDILDLIGGIGAFRCSTKIRCKAQYQERLKSYFYCLDYYGNVVTVPVYVEARRCIVSAARANLFTLRMSGA